MTKLAEWLFILSVVMAPWCAFVLNLVSVQFLFKYLFLFFSVNLLRSKGGQVLKH